MIRHELCAEICQHQSSCNKRFSKATSRVPYHCIIKYATASLCGYIWSDYRYPYSRLQTKLKPQTRMATIKIPQNHPINI